MNAKITQGKRQLWQWDTGVQLMLFDIGTANEVHFATPDGVIRRDIVNNMCNIPDVVLQRAGTMVCYVFNREPYEGDTRHEFHFDVLPRPKPADYIDPPGEADYLDQLYDRLKDEIVGPPGPQGEQGQRGTGYLRILSKPADKVEMVDGKVVAHSLSLNIVKAEANVDEVRVGDCLLYNGAYVYPVVAVDVNVYTSKVVDLHGPAGPQGIEGERGEAGPAGPQGAPGSSGVYIGTEAPTDGANVWIDPEGKGTETLPNPHPLVINGVSYDGSERVEIKEGEYELINTVTVDEATNAINITQDSAGKSFKLDAAIAKITKPAGATAYILQCYTYHEIQHQQLRIVLDFNNTGAMGARFEADSRYGYYTGTGYMPSTAYSNSGYAIALANANLVTIPASSKIIRLYFLAYKNATIPAGSTIEVWGVRADA